MTLVTGGLLIDSSFSSGRLYLHTQRNCRKQRTSCQAHVLLGFCFAGFKDGISCDAKCLKAEHLFRVRRPDTVPLFCHWDKWTLWHSSLCQPTAFSLGSRPVGGLDSLSENWRSLSGHKRTAWPSPETGTLSWNSKLDCAFQLTALIDLQVFGMVHKGKRGACPCSMS